MNLSKASLVVVKHPALTTKFIGGDGLDLSSEVFVSLTLIRNPGREMYVGLSIQFPLCRAEQLESSGFGVSYTTNTGTAEGVELAQRYKIVVKFPREGLTTTVSGVPSDLAIRLPASVRDKCCLLKVNIENVDDIRIDGLGMPRLNSGHECDAWLQGSPVVGNLTLLDILTSPEQRFIVKFKGEVLEKQLKTETWPAPFEYPWGDTHFWDADRFRQQAEENPGGRFLPAWTFATDNDHAAVLTQSLAQDIVWVDDAAKRLSNLRLRAYTAESHDSSAWTCLVVPCDQQFRETFKYACRRLAHCRLSVVFFDEKGNERSIRHAEICENPEILSVMRNHPIAEHELVLRVSPEAKDEDLDEDLDVCLDEVELPEFDIKTFSDRILALQAFKQSSSDWNIVSLKFHIEVEEHERKCDAVNEMLPGSRPSNPSVFGLTVPKKDIYAQLIGSPEDIQHVAERQKLARAVIRGTGFQGIALEQPWPKYKMSGMFPGLPMANFFQFENDVERRAVLERMLPGDRERFSRYLSNRHLGLAMITAGPGFGKTTALAVASYGLVRSVGRVYMSAPTNIACDNAADRLMDVSTDVTRRINGKADTEPLCRRLLVVRGYKWEDEVAAFMSILQCPESINDAVPKHGRHGSPWKLENSIAFWLLRALGSAVVPAVRPDDCSRLHDASRGFQGDKKLENILKLASMDMTWEEYVKAGEVPETRIQSMMRYVLMQADVVCTTPAESSKLPYSKWKLEQACGFTIDEAACMSRPDFYTVWGNTMMPCVMAGDRLLLNVAVRSFHDVTSDGDGVYRNRHGPDARISIMEFLQASGWPIFRLHTQLRMARGLFALSQEVIYPELRAQYGVRCHISLPCHASGRAMEAFMLRKFPDILRPCPEGTLREVFVHCPGSRVRVSPMTKSKSSPDQVRIALRLLDELIRDTQARGTQINPSEIIIIVLHSANVEVVKHQLKRYASLVGKVVVSTVESIQGKERPISVVIFGTNEITGPGFSKEARRLNVAISRHTSFLLLIGDINVTGDFRSGVSTTNAHGRGGGRGGRAGGMDLWKLAGQRFLARNDNGELECQVAQKLRAILILMHRAGRVVTVVGGV
ncbi:unnamed protein product [Clonostachys rhizophaga]|uniref:DNA2/NAM7 helicase-like C-terminal domain-containing protein n=1 Tax=Clonostachys rhizophaga TaxID=160324 RepID=A0A9N9YT05_9HYPO|nr:unnamed protein product [Clonostachys rhizophaga]